MKTTKRPSVGNAQDADGKLTQRVNCKITPESYERLLIHAIKAKCNPGELIDRLIRDHLRAWRVQDNTTARGKIEDRHSEPPCVDISAPPEPIRDAA